MLYWEHKVSRFIVKTHIIAVRSICINNICWIKNKKRSEHRYSSLTCDCLFEQQENWSTSSPPPSLQPFLHLHLFVSSTSASTMIGDGNWTSGEGFPDSNIWGHRTHQCFLVPLLNEESRFHVHQRYVSSPPFVLGEEATRFELDTPGCSESGKYIVAQEQKLQRGVSCCVRRAGVIQVFFSLQFYFTP